MPDYERVYDRPTMLAGIPVADRQVIQLAEHLRQTDALPTAEGLEDAYDAGQKIVALTIPDRDAIRCTLIDSCRDELAEPRGVLWREHEWRLRHGPSASPSR